MPASWAAFLAELERLWPTRVDTSFTDATLATVERTTWHDALGFAGATMIRRMIGFAYVSDTETLDDSDRVPAVGRVLRIARRLLVDRASLVDPKALWRFVGTELAEHS